MHNELNPKLWTKSGSLKPEVRAHLLKIAERWKEFAKLPGKTIDCVMLGGNAQYNYTPFSDIDVHWVLDFKAFRAPEEFIKEYLTDKQDLWRDIHGAITIYGYPVELYAQDSNEPRRKGQGVYSLIKDKWLMKPEKVKVDYNDPHLTHKVKQYAGYIDRLIARHASDAVFKKFKDRLKNMRAAGIKKGGEYSYENLVFKELRNQGYLEKMRDFLHKREDRKFSLIFRKK
jgi:hypothetical protein